MSKKAAIIIGMLILTMNISVAQERYSLHLGFGPGVAIPISRFHKTHEVGVLGYADVNIFVRNNLSAGVRYSFNYFKGKDQPVESTTLSYDDNQIHEVLLMGNFFFKGKWRPFLSFGLGCYLGPGYNDLGFVPSVGVMHQFAEKWFLTIRGDMAYMRKNDFSYCKVVVGVSLPFYSPK